MLTDICLPILKYSYATSVRADQKVSWTHLQASDIFLILKSDNRTHYGHLIMKIVHGIKVLESVDMASYIDAAVEARKGAERVGVSPQVEQLPIFGITKDVALAVRYRLKDSQTRRFQLRMQSFADCRRVVDVLLQRGMEFQEHRPQTARPVTACPPPPTSPERLLTATLSSHDFEDDNSKTAKPNPFQPQILEAGSLSQKPFSKPEKPAVASEVQSSETVSSQFFTRDKAAAAEQELPPRSSSTMPPPSFRSAFSSEQPFPLSSDPVQGQAYTPRPSTSTTSIVPDNLGGQEVPSPFAQKYKQPEGSHNGREGSGSRPGSSSLSMPPLPKPRLVKEATGSPTRAGSASLTRVPTASRPGTASPLKRSFAASEEDNVARPQTTQGATGVSESSDQQSSSTRYFSATSETAPIEPKQRRITPMDELLHGRKPLADRSTNTKVPRMSSLMDAPHEEVSPPPSPPKDKAPPKVAIVGRDYVAKTSEAITSPQRVQGEATLKEYAAQSQPDRQAALDEFMIAHLEDPAFMTLCEDVENCWRRIALGL